MPHIQSWTWISCLKIPSIAKHKHVDNYPRKNVDHSHFVYNLTEHVFINSGVALWVLSQLDKERRTSAVKGRTHLPCPYSNSQRPGTMSMLKQTRREDDSVPFLIVTEFVRYSFCKDVEPCSFYKAKQLCFVCHAMSSIWVQETQPKKQQTYIEAFLTWCHF